MPGRKWLTANSEVAACLRTEPFGHSEVCERNFVWSFTALWDSLGIVTPYKRHDPKRHQWSGRRSEVSSRSTPQCESASVLARVLGVSLGIPEFWTSGLEWFRLDMFIIFYHRKMYFEEIYFIDMHLMIFEVSPHFQTDYWHRDFFSTREIPATPMMPTQWFPVVRPINSKCGICYGSWVMLTPKLHLLTLCFR